jgi:predicted nuclease with TOPRIM domain
MAEYPELPPEDPNKYCACCHALLPTPLSEFGDMREPICQKCFLDPMTLTTEERKYKAELEEELSEHESTIEDLQEKIKELEYEKSGLIITIRRVRTLPYRREELLALDRWKSAVLV